MPHARKRSSYQIYLIEMKIFNKQNSQNTGDLDLLKSYMLISQNNVSDTKISIQVSIIPVDSEQPIHKHEPEQCYYIIQGKGLMIIENEEKVVNSGDAIYVPANKNHGIKNIGQIDLEYLTANSPAFDKDYENRLWPTVPQK
jgi:mannose-6-phosphate isomerase-like protein (cupin superfamily)